MGDVKNLNEYLRELRKERSLNQTEAADRCGWYQEKICKIEKGKQQPTIADLKVLARVFKVPFVKLINMRARAA